ncbi:MAG: DUF2914 domain-containing protein [Myxococcales bacterium]|nr:DUF2914 domain-containing protein [Myxococcales bacterium]
MKRSLASLIAVFALLTSTALAAPGDAGVGPAAVVETPAETLPELTTFELGAGLKARALVGRASAFSPAVGRVYAHATFDNPGAPTTVQMVWKRAGKEVQRLDLNVGKSPRWRTWSYKRIGPRDVGEWTVTVLDAQGTEIGEAAFTVAPVGVGPVSAR